MKTLDFIKMSFPEMDEKKQVSTVGGSNDYNDPIPGGQYGEGTVTAPGYHPPNYDNWPILDPGYYGGGYGGGSSSGNNNGGGETSTHPTEGLHPEMVDHIMATLKFSNISPEQKEQFKKILSEIDKSPLGDKMLKAWDKAMTDHPDKIPTVTPDSPKTQGAVAEYDSGTKHLNLANFFDPSLIDTWQTYNLAHELFHSFQHLSGMDMSSLNVELDAYMFGSKVVLEAFPDDSYAKLLAKNTEISTPSNEAQTQFNQAWDKYLNGDLSNENYQNLINNFHDGSKVGSHYNGTINGSQTPTFFQQSGGTTSGGSGSNGSGGPNIPQDPSGWNDGGNTSPGSGYGTNGYN